MEEIHPANGKKNDNEEISDLEKNIIRQMEYYFGDINLPRDQFLKEQIELDDGWVPYTTMLKFNRLAALTTDTSIITTALSKSKNQMIEVSEDGQKVRRSTSIPIPELNEDRKKEITSRTVYIKGFPKENTTLDECLQFFQAYSTPENVIMRRYLDKHTQKHVFKGSLFVTFKTKEDAEKFLDETSVKLNDIELIRKWQANYFEEKKIENEAKYNKAIQKKMAKQKNEEEKPIVFPRGTVLVFSKLPEDMNRNAIKEAISLLGGDVGFIRISDNEAWVRLQKAATAIKVFEKMTDGKLMVNDEELECRLPEESEENAFLNEMAEELVKRKQNNYKLKCNKQWKRKGGFDYGSASKRKCKG